MTVSAPDLAAVAQRVIDHGARLREDVETGRLDELDEALAARAEALRALADHVASLPRPLDDDVTALLTNLREDDRCLMEWMQEEKRNVGRALSSLRGRVSDPYEERLEGPVVLNQRR
jgi:hypothetical protein